MISRNQIEVPLEDKFHFALPGNGKLRTSIARIWRQRWKIAGMNGKIRIINAHFDIVKRVTGCLSGSAVLEWGRRRGNSERKSSGDSEEALIHQNGMPRWSIGLEQFSISGYELSSESYNSSDEYFRRLAGGGNRDGRRGRVQGRENLAKTNHDFAT